MFSPIAIRRLPTGVSQAGTGDMVTPKLFIAGLAKANWFVYLFVLDTTNWLQWQKAAKLLPRVDILKTDLTFLFF